MSAPSGAGLRPAEVAEAMRFALPWRTHVAVLTAAGELPDLGGARKARPLAAPPAESFARRLEELRAGGCEYLLVPLRDGSQPPAVQAAVERAGTTVVEDAAGYQVLSLHPPPPSRSPDDLPLPPAHLIRVTSGCLRQAVNHPERLYESYLEAGAEAAACMRRALERQGLALERFESVLDFGCGCGRLIRRWRDLDADVHGCDYNPLLVDWCAQNLRFARFGLNPLDPSLPYDDGAFDFAYAISIFTHLDEDQQLPWLHELARVVRPGGVLLVTVAGLERAQRQLSEQDLERFHAGDLVVNRADLAGTNACAAFHPERYVAQTFSAGLDLLEHVPGGAEDVRQDQVLLRKPAAETRGG